MRMRFGFGLASLLLPQLLAAQVIKHFTVGSYVPVGSPATRQQGGLYSPNGQQLLVRDLAGETHTFSPAQVRSFRIADRTFVTTGSFQVKSGLGDVNVARGFAELLDSGRVVLLRYSSPASAAAMGASGALVYGGSDTNQLYLLRQADAPGLTPIQLAWPKGSSRFKEALRPYLASRPDLGQLLDHKRLRPADVPAIVHALNTGQPYAKLPAAARAD